MNFQCRPVLKPIKVFVINPLAPASQLLITKIMSGVVFGNEQLIDLCLIVCASEIKTANAFRLEIESCAYSCTNSTMVTSDLPKSDACEGDVFCFMTNFRNPNRFDFSEEEYKQNFETIYLIIKFATTFKFVKSDYVNNNDGKKTVGEKKRNPIFIADGLVALDILKTMAVDMPPDVLFCPTPITAIAKAVLADYLNVQCNMINELFVWAANDEVFHVEVVKPLVVHGDTDNNSRNQSEMSRKDFLESRSLDSTQFSDSWMKKEFIEKVATSASKNPYGCIYKAAEFGKTLRDIWVTRTRDDGAKVYANIGVISDGSLGTIKGYPYVLPIIFDKGIWSVNSSFVEDTHLKQELKRINKTAKNHHQQLITYCKKFLQDNFTQGLKDEDDSVSMY
ncbi:uncharacterized protein LOC112043598 [Bicyclus anynana]|uniref:Uncharacterized protein LOC112043598 n=1 Tax=Bicyclus anynana TaxID=110368 RepID=A0A6J1MHV3_BICAN|nr:uncharacterized protein LOC112043598 [Bicyclus anynana]